MCRLIRPRLHASALLLVAFSVMTAAGQAPTVTGPEERQVVSRAGTRGSTAGPAEHFTGTVRVDPLFTAKDAASFTGAYVTFEPGSRSAWHIHPTGQHLVVIAGVGRTGQSDGTVEVIRAGDVVWCPPGVRHWHGAAPDSSMTHLAITGVANGQAVTWMEKVTDQEYGAVRPLLSPLQQALIPIAAFTATGEQDRLRPALVEGLTAGMTVNEIREVIVQMYAYAGFPRSLNALQTFIEVLEDRKSRGINDIRGREASPLPADQDRDRFGAQVRAKITGQAVTAPPTGYQLFAPIIDTFLKEHLFADIFARDLLDHQSRELATNAALTSMTGTSAQLRAHLNGALNVGLTEAQMRSFISILEAKVGRREAENCARLLEDILRERGR